MTTSAAGPVAFPRRFVAPLAALALLATTAPVLADAARGTAAYKARAGIVTVTFTHAYLMKGPDLVDGRGIRRLVLSTKDIGAALNACQRMTCSDGGIGEGMTVDFDAGPPLNYWFVASDQLIQYSGTAKPDVVTLTTDSPTRLAGTLTFDHQSAGGPTVEVQFDAALVKELKK